MESDNSSDEMRRAEIDKKLKGKPQDKMGN